MNLTNILHHYLIAALWSSNDESDENGGEPMDTNYSIEDVTSELEDKSLSDIRDFVNQCKKRGIDLSEFNEEQMGHDLWLTRNGHGAGFWDRDGEYVTPSGEDVKDILSDIARNMGEVYLYVTDDQKIAA